jgi:excisionase family DNA binding protein
MRVKQAAALLEVSQSTVYAVIACGRLRCCRVGLGRGAIRISADHARPGWFRRTNTERVRNLREKEWQKCARELRTD